MTTLGIIMMLISYGVAISLMVFCFYRILRIPRPGLHEHSPLGIDTGDKDEPE